MPLPVFIALTTPWMLCPSTYFLKVLQWVRQLPKAHETLPFGLNLHHLLADELLMLM
jgi:hypothetical protein